MTNETQKVKVLSSLVDEESGMISWTVQLENGKEADLLWTKQEFGPTFGISSEIPNSLINEFCQNMHGKSIQLMVSGEK